MRALQNFPAPSARHLCRNPAPRISSSVRSDIFRCLRTANMPPLTGLFHFVNWCFATMPRLRRFPGGRLCRRPAAARSHTRAVKYFQPLPSIHALRPVRRTQSRSFRIPAGFKSFSPGLARSVYPGSPAVAALWRGSRPRNPQPQRGRITVAACRQTAALPKKTKGAALYREAATPGLMMQSLWDSGLKICDLDSGR
jgi:hypothetical protein